MHQGNSAVNGPHQGGWVTSSDGRDWFIHFQDVIELGRIVHLQPMCFADGWPFIGQDQNGDGIGEPVESWYMPEEDMPSYAIAQSDDFEEKHLGLQWQWQANPNSAYYSLTDRPGYLRLFCWKNPERENYLWYAPNVLTQIPQKKELTMTVKMELTGKEAGDFGGIGVEGHIYGYAGLYSTGEKMEIRCYRGIVTEKMFHGEAEERLVFSSKLEGNVLWLSMSLSDDKTYKFSYSTDGVHFTQIQEKFPLSRATWTGAKLCLWSCSKENKNSEGYCDYEYVTIV